MSADDCPRCGAPLREHGDGRWDCPICGTEFVDPREPWQPAEIVQAVRTVVRERRLLGPSCLARRCRNCSASGCRCWCHDKAAADAS